MKPLPELTASVRQHYEKLFQDGYLVGVHVSKWSMSTALDKQDIKHDDPLPSIFKLGKKMLVRQEEFNKFNRLENKARRYLSLNSHDFPISDAHFVPKKKIAIVLDTLNRFKTEFDALTDDFVKNADTHKKNIIEDYPDLEVDLNDAWPQYDKLRQKFSFTISMFELQMPREFGEIDIQKLITQDKAEAQIRQQLNASLQKHYQDSIVQLEQFVEKASKTLRWQVATLCNNIKWKIDRKEIISHKSIAALRQEIEHVRELNVFEDGVIKEELDKLDAFVDPGVDYNSDADALNALNEAISQAIDRTKNITDLATVSGSYFRAIKI